MALPRKALTREEVFNLSDEEFMSKRSSIINALVELLSPEEFSRELLRHLTYDFREDLRKKTLHSVRPRTDKTLELVDHALLLEDEVSEMARTVNRLRAYLRSNLLGEQHISGMWLDSIEMPREAQDTREEVDADDGLKRDASWPSTPLEFSPTFQREEIVSLTQVIYEEAPLLLKETTDAYEKRNIALMGGERSLADEIGDPFHKIGFLYLAIRNIEISAKIAKSLITANGKQIETPTFQDLWMEHVDERFTVPRLMKLRRICGFPEDSRDPKWLSDKCKSELQDEEVQKKLLGWFPKLILQRCGLWFGEGYQEGDYDDEDPASAIALRGVTGAEITRLFFGPSESSTADASQSEELTSDDEPTEEPTVEPEEDTRQEQQEEGTEAAKTELLTADIPVHKTKKRNFFKKLKDKLRKK